MYHQLVKRVERIRLYPTASQTKTLHFMLDVTRELYNALLEERRDAWRRRRVAISAKEQYAEITALRSKEDRLDGRLAAVYRETEDAALHRLELAFQAFFRRMRRGETPGYPRFKGRLRWRQLEFPHGDRALKFDEQQRRVRVPGVGAVRLQLARAHEHLANARRDALHKIAGRLIADADVIALEALNLRAMTRSAKGTLEQPGRYVAAKAGLNRALLDAGFGLLRQMIVAKAEEAARTVAEALLLREVRLRSARRYQRSAGDPAAGRVAARRERRLTGGPR